MRGVVLAGGLGTRLKPLTDVTNKHLLPIYNKPMIFYPIETLVRSGIKEIAIVVSGESAGSFIRIIKNGKDLGLNKVEYFYQEGNKGIADALALTKDFANKENITVILGDNTTDADISNEVNNFKEGGHIFLKRVFNPRKYGVAKIVENKLLEIVEKPKDPPSNCAVTGLYIYDSKVYDFIEKCELSSRGEYEITTVNNFYIKEEKLTFSYLEGFWQDAGSIDNLYLANKYWFEKCNPKFMY